MAATPTKTSPSVTLMLHIVAPAPFQGAALIAVDENGLEQLDRLYSLSKDCTEANLRASSNPLTGFVCNTPRPPITSEMVTKGVTQLSEGTKAVVMDRRYVLPGGRLVVPYPVNTYDLARDGVIEVEKIKITQPPTEGLEGWVQTDFLARVGSPPL